MDTQTKVVAKVTVEVEIDMDAYALHYGCQVPDEHPTLADEAVSHIGDVVAQGVRFRLNDLGRWATSSVTAVRKL